MNSESPNSPILLFKGGRIITGKPGEVFFDFILAVEGSNIVFLGKEEELPKDKRDKARVLSFEGCTLMPGLIDAHVHFWGARTVDYFHRALVPDQLNMIRAVKDVEALLEAGFTTVREAGGNKSIHLRTAIEEGTIKGPRILSAHRVICITGGHYDLHFLPLDHVKKMRGNFRLADGVDDCRKAVREQLREGADFIKICTTGGIMSQRGRPEAVQFSPDELSAIVEESHNHGMRVACHAYSRNGIINALRAGVDSIEHGTFLDEAISDEMVARGIFLVPTLSIMHKIATEGASHGMSPWALKKGAEINEVAARAFNLARKKGILIASGTDFSGAPPMRHGENALELRLMVQAGMSTADAISSATQVAAAAIGLGDRTGTLEKGKWADILIVEGDPLEDISVLQERSRIKMVVKGGRTIVEK
jgi:imidazolonepropionase-like amidohydrolase